MLFIDKRQCVIVAHKLLSFAKVVEEKAPEYIVPKNIEKESREHSFFLFFTANIDQALMLRRIRPRMFKGRYVFGAEALWFYSRRLVSYNYEIMLPETILELGREGILEHLIRWAYPGIVSPEKCSNYWLQNSDIILRKYGGDIREFAERYGNNAERVVKKLREFEGIGLKLSNFIARIMHKTGIWDLKNIEAIDIPPDIHLQKLALRTGMIRVKHDALVKLDSQPVIDAVRKAYRIAALSYNVPPIELDEPSWHIGRLCCSRKFGDLSCVKCDPEKMKHCPLADVCKGYCPLSDVCVRQKVTMLRQSNIVDARIKRKKGISELEDLYPLIEKWLEQQDPIWFADWPLKVSISHVEYIDYVAYYGSKDKVIAVEGVVDGRTKLRKHERKIRGLSVIANEPYVATNSKLIAEYVMKTNLGLLLLIDSKTLKLAKKPSTTKYEDKIRRHMIKICENIQRKLKL